MSGQMKSQYKDILNALDEMQQSPAYAARKHILFYAEQAIFSLEKRLLLSEKYEAQRDELLEALEVIAGCYESGQDSTGSRASQAYDMRCLARQAILGADVEQPL